MFVVSNPELLEMIKDHQKSYETPEACIIRLVKQGIQLQSVVDAMHKEVSERWPEKRRA